MDIDKIETEVFQAIVMKLNTLDLPRKFSVPEVRSAVPTGEVLLIDSEKKVLNRAVLKDTLTKLEASDAEDAITKRLSEIGFKLGVRKHLDEFPNESTPDSKRPSVPKSLFLPTGKGSPPKENPNGGSKLLGLLLVMLLALGGLGLGIRYMLRSDYTESATIVPPTKLEAAKTQAKPVTPPAPSTSPVQVNVNNVDPAEVRKLRDEVTQLNEQLIAQSKLIEELKKNNNSKPTTAPAANPAIKEDKLTVPRPQIATLTVDVTKLPTDVINELLRQGAVWGSKEKDR